MIIKLNTDKNISGNEKLEKYLDSLISDGLKRFAEDITRVEVHLADENGDKKGENDKRCTLEARLANKQPMAVTSYGSTIEKAVSSGIDKLTSMLGSRLKRN
mgnify:CR=1 FL=1